MTELYEASKDLAGFVSRNGIGPILRGALLSRAARIDVHYPASLSNQSPLFKLPVDAVQRGRDHGEFSSNCPQRVVVSLRNGHAVLKREHNFEYLEAGEGERRAVCYCCAYRHAASDSLSISLHGDPYSPL